MLQSGIIYLAKVELVIDNRAFLYLPYLTRICPKNLGTP